MLERRMRSIRLQQIDTKQFNLAYLANVDFESTDNMSVAEFDNLHNILLERKRFEREEQEKAIKAMKSKKK